MTVSNARPRVWPVFTAYAAVLVLSLLVGLAAVVAWLVLELPGEVTSSPPLLIASVAASAAVMTAAAWIGARLSPTPASRRLRAGPSRLDGLGLAAAVAGSVAFSQAFDWLFAWLGWTGGILGAVNAAIARMTGAELALMVLAGGVAAAAAEELFFRGYMQTRLAERWGPRPAITITALAFGLAHVDLRHGALALAVGLFLGWITERAASIRPAMSAHVANNVLSVFQYGFLPEPSAAGAIVGVPVCVAATGIAVAVLRRQPAS